MIKKKIVSKRKELKDSTISIDNDFDYEVRCRRKVLVPFLKAARSNSHYARLMHEKLKVNGEVFDMELCLDTLNKSGIGENINEEKRKVIKDKVIGIVKKNSVTMRNEIVKSKKSEMQESAEVGVLLNAANSDQAVGNSMKTRDLLLTGEKRGKAVKSRKGRKSVVMSPRGHKRSEMCQESGSDDGDICGVSERNKCNVSQQLVKVKEHNKDDREKREG